MLAKLKNSLFKFISNKHVLTISIIIAGFLAVMLLIVSLALYPEKFSIAVFFAAIGFCVFKLYQIVLDKIEDIQEKNFRNGKR